MAFQVGQKVRGIDLGDGAPVVGGREYTVKAYSKNPHRLAPEGDGYIKERAHIPCVTVEEVEGYFMESRFEAI